MSKTTNNTKTTTNNTTKTENKKQVLNEKLNFKLSATSTKSFAISNKNKNACTVYNVFYIVDTQSNSRVIECWSKKDNKCELVISALALSDKELEATKEQTNQKRKNIFINNADLSKFIESHLTAYSKKLAKVVE